MSEDPSLVVRSGSGAGWVRVGDLPRCFRTCRGVRRSREEGQWGRRFSVYTGSPCAREGESLSSSRPSWRPSLPSGPRLALFSGRETGAKRTRFKQASKLFVNRSRMVLPGRSRTITTVLDCQIASWIWGLGISSLSRSLEGCPTSRSCVQSVLREGQGHQVRRFVLDLFRLCYKNYFYYCRCHHGHRLQILHGLVTLYYTIQSS